MASCVATDSVVVLGFGAAATSAIVALRRSGYDGAIRVVNDAGTMPYSPVLTSYYVGGRISREQCFSWSDEDVAGMVDDFRAKVRVDAIDVASHEVVLEDASRLKYSKLLIATGARPVKADMPGLLTRKPHVLRTMDDADRLREAFAAQACRSVLVSGTSMVGLKVAEAGLDCGLDVTLLGRSQHILRSAAHPMVAERFEAALLERGVTLRLGQRIANANDEAAGAYRVEFDNGDVARFDEMVVAQGVVPNLDFVVRGHGIPTAVAENAARALMVDAFMRTDIPDVFAAGDVVRTLDMLTGEHRIMGLWQNAVQQGRCAGEAIAAELAGRTPRRCYPGAISSNVIHVRDILFASAGLMADAPGRRIAIEGTGDSGRLAAFAYDDRNGKERLVGFNLLAIGEAADQGKLMDDMGSYRSTILKSCV